MEIVVRYGTKSISDTGGWCLFFVSPECKEEGKKGYIDMRSQDLHQKILRSAKCPLRCIKPKKGMNALVIVTEELDEPPIKDFEEAFSSSLGRDFRFVLDDPEQRLNDKEVEEIELLPNLKKICPGRTRSSSSKDAELKSTVHEAVSRAQARTVTPAHSAEVESDDSYIEDCDVSDVIERIEKRWGLNGSPRKAILSESDIRPRRRIRRRV